MPAASQTRLLRVLSEGKFFRVGGREELNVDVRIVAATHQDLEVLVRDGSFREDLFHRLNVVRLRIPALRERREDIPKLVKTFLKRTAAELNVDERQLNDESMQYLCSLPWPGNIRQLENTCRWLSVMAPSQTVQLDDLPPDLKEQEGESTASEPGWEAALGQFLAQQFGMERDNVLAEVEPRFERVLIETALAHTGQRKIEAARLLGWGRNTLTRKLKELEIES
jgi:two-component system nitrogen regulation response regulator GlnG